jgi:hypothetical protein
MRIFATGGALIRTEETPCGHVSFGRRARIAFLAGVACPALGTTWQNHEIVVVISPACVPYGELAQECVASRATQHFHLFPICAHPCPIRAPSAAKSRSRFMPIRADSWVERFVFPDLIDIIAPHARPVRPEGF